MCDRLAAYPSVQFPARRKPLTLARRPSRYLLTDLADARRDHLFYAVSIPRLSRAVSAIPTPAGISAPGIASPDRRDPK